MFMMYLDLDELDSVFAKNRFWTMGRRNLAWFRREDYLGPTNVPLSEAVRARVHDESGLTLTGPIRMLAHLRYFGHCFNPVTIYYCYDPRGERVEVVVAEINNTPWGERHAYVLPVSAEAQGDKMHFEMDKRFHVSPFWPMNHRYHWDLTAPSSSLVAHMENHEGDEVVFDATLSLRRLEASPKNLNRVLRAYPLMTMKVVAAIYWQALRLYMGGAKFYSHPKNNAEPHEDKS
jgi:DUF1365 family protein